MPPEAETEETPKQDILDLINAKVKVRMIAPDGEVMTCKAILNKLEMDEDFEIELEFKIEGVTLFTEGPR